MARGPVLVGGDGRHGEPYETLLGDVVDRSELATLHEVLVRGLAGPTGLTLAGEAPCRHIGEPVDDRGGGLTEEVVVAALGVVPDRGGGVEGEGVGPLPTGAGVGVGEGIDVRAVVVVTHAVDRGADDRRVVGVTMAVRHPLDRSGVRIGDEQAFEVAGAAEPVARAVDVAPVGLQAVDAGGVAAVLDDLVGRERVERAGGGVERSETERRRAVQVGEDPPDDQSGLVRTERHGVDGAVRGGGPREGGTVGRADGGDLGPTHAVHSGEPAAEVDRTVADRDREDFGVHVGCEAGDQRAVGGVEGCDPVPRHPVDRGERADDVDPGLVRRDGHGPDAGVDRRGKAGVQHPGTKVERQYVAARRLVGADGSTGRTGVGELPTRVDGVTDDDLVPDHTVNLHGRQHIGRHAGGRTVHHVVGGCGGHSGFGGR